MGDCVVRRLLFGKLVMSMIIVFVVFFLVPLVVSISYGNIPFHKDFLGYRIQGAPTSGIPLLGIPAGNTTTSNVLLPSNSSSVDPSDYYRKKEMSFWHVQRDLGVLILVAILAILLDRKFGNWFLRWVRRR